MTAFDADLFVQACMDALQESDRLGAVSEVMQRAVREPELLRSACPVPLDPDEDGVLYRSDDLFVCHAVFPRQFHTGIHDHTIEAVIGVWAGHEDNHLFARDGDTLRSRGVQRVECGEVLALDADAVHDVHTSASTWSGALHVYLGDLVAIQRSGWARADSAPLPLDGDEQERRWQAVAVATGLVRA